MPEAAILTGTTQNTAKTAGAEVLPAQEPLIQDFYKKPLQRLAIQTQLTVGAPDDPYEKEADTVADQVMRMPEQNFLQLKCASCAEETIQREENEEKEPADKPKLKLQLTEPDFLSLRTPFFERNAMHLWDPGSALGVWQYNFSFFRRFGLDDNWSGKAANLTTPLFINSQLKAGNPTWWEVTDSQLNTSSIVGTVPVFSFDSDFKNWKPLPFLQKKSLETPEVGLAAGSHKESFIQRKCAHCEEEEKINREPLSASVTPFIQTKSGTSTPTVSDSLSQSIQSSKGGGSPIDSTTQSFMSSRFGADFGHVKVHTDGESIQMNRELNAKAFTVGNDVYFNQGQYQPGSSGGRHLLAHELTHVVQQGGSGNTPQAKLFGSDDQFDSKDECPPKVEVQQSGLSDADIAAELYGNPDVIINHIDEYNFYVEYEHLLNDWKPVFKDCVPAEVSGTDVPPIPPEQMQCRADAEFTGELEMTEASVTAANGIRLHTTPDPYDCDYVNRIGVSGIIYPKKTKVTVIASGNISNTGWLKLQTFDGHEGWIEERFIAREKKDGLKDAVTKEKYVIQAGDNLEALIRQQYKDYPYTTGNDRRTIAHALYILNKDESGAFYFEGNGESWWKDFLDSDFAETRKIYSTIRLLQGKVIRLPSKAYIDLLRDKGQVGVRPEWKNTAIEFARSIEGFVEGVGYGFVKAAVDTVVGLWDLVKGIFTGELFEQAYDFYKQIEANGIGFLWELIKGFFIGVYKDFEAAWNNPNPYKKWFFFGEIVGMILFEIAIAYLTAGAGLAKHLGKLDKIFDAVPGLRKLAAKAATKVDDIPSAEAAKLSKIRSAEAKLENLGDMPGGTRKMLRDPKNEKLIQSLNENPDIRAEDLFTGDTAGSSVPRGFKPDGTIPRAGTPERPVVNQGPHPTCGSRSCEMATGTMGQTISPAMLEKMLAEAGTKGVTTDQMVQMLKWNKVVGEAKTGYGVTDLAKATKGGNPAIAVIKTTNPKHPLHAVVVDGVTERLGQQVVAIRNPWGIQYFQTVDEFTKIFTGNAVNILHSY